MKLIDERDAPRKPTYVYGFIVLSLIALQAPDTHEAFFFSSLKGNFNVEDF